VMWIMSVKEMQALQAQEEGSPATNKLLRYLNP
jgi:hypothetical protein